MIFFNRLKIKIEHMFCVNQKQKKKRIKKLMVYTDS